VQSPGAIESEIRAFGSGSDRGLINVPDGFSEPHREIFVTQAARYHLPAIYPFRSFARAGGLASYGNDLRDSYRQAAMYVDRILRGDRPADLPVEQPTRFELTINLKTAKALDLSVPQSVLVRADEVIE
jgi:putative tryptophan/tyrosine transport system substrate-binding protein